MDFIQSFIDFSTKKNCAPAKGEQIIADDARHYYRIEGDRIGTKKGGYQLKIDGNFAVGWVSNYKLGETHTFVSSINGTHLPQLTSEEKHELKLKIEKEKEEKRKELIKMRSDAALKAKDIWNQAAKEGSHPYIERKQCNLNGCRIYQGKLVVPIYVDGKLSSLQTIDVDGNKLFLSGGEITGGYYPLAAKEENKDILILCEGLATGDSLRKALRRPIIVCFTASNLIAVAKVIKQKYPTSKLVIAADNDAYTEIPKGTLKNIGVLKAQQAAASVGGCQVIIPDILNDKNSDWNDWFCGHGAVSIIPKFDIALGQEETHKPILVVNNDEPEENVPEYLNDTPPIEAYGDQEEVKVLTLYAAGERPEDINWREKLYYKENKDGESKLVAKHLGNCRVFLENDPQISNLFCYDEFSHEKILYRCPPWENPKRFKVRTITDQDITSLTVALERRGIQQPFNVVSRLLTSVICENPRNPAKEYFNNLKWDGVRRLDNWLIDYCGSTFDPEDYVQAIGRKWLAAAVARVLNPGIKFDYMLVLEGKQRVGKSMILRELATINGHSYFNDTIKINEINSDRNVMKLQGVIIIELAELSAFKDMSDEEIKSIISSQENISVLKFENEAKKFPRQFVLGGTTNKTEYLKDRTGNSRFWCVRVSNKLDIEGIKKNKEQIWAEAVHVYKSGEKLYLEDNLYRKATVTQEGRMVSHPWSDDIEGLVYCRDVVSEKEIWEKLGISDRSKRTRGAMNEVTSMMQELGFERKKRRFGSSPERCWERVGKESERGSEDDVEIDMEGDVA